MKSNHRVITIPCPICEQPLRHAIAKPPTFTDRATCEDCQVQWLITIDTAINSVTCHDESGLIAPQSIDLEDL